MSNAGYVANLFFKHDKFIMEFQLYDLSNKANTGQYTYRLIDCKTGEDMKINRSDKKLFIFNKDIGNDRMFDYVAYEIMPLEVFETFSKLRK